MEVEAAIVAEALEKRRIGDVAASRERAEPDPRRGGGRGRPGPGGGPGRPAATSRRRASRRRARSTPASPAATIPPHWAELAARWRALGQPYRVAMARWRQAEAIMGGAVAGPGRRAGPTPASSARDAREPLSEAVAIALQLHARPLLRELRELAGRALIPLPPAVDDAARGAAPAPAPSSCRPRPRPPIAEAQAPGGDRRGPAGLGADTFGLSKRELEVLALIAQGRTNREIGDRLFISQKTVGVHVGNILAKLGVSGRVEAAAVAIRLGLEDGRAPAGLTRRGRPRRHAAPGFGRIGAT